MVKIEIGVVQGGQRVKAVAVDMCSNVAVENYGGGICYNYSFLNFFS